MLLAHTKAAAAKLSGLFRTRGVIKRYRVRVHGRFCSETICIDTPLDGKPARSRVVFLAYDQDRDRSLLEVDIETGRKHQIRRHLAAMGFPVEGDRLYGGGEEQDLQLQSVYLAFDCPLKGQRREYRLPEHLQAEPSGG